MESLDRSLLHCKAWSSSWTFKPWTQAAILHNWNCKFPTLKNPGDWISKFPCQKKVNSEPEFPISMKSAVFLNDNVLHNFWPKFSARNEKSQATFWQEFWSIQPVVSATRQTGAKLTQPTCFRCQEHVLTSKCAKLNHLDMQFTECEKSLRSSLRLDAFAVSRVGQQVRWMSLPVNLTLLRSVQPEFYNFRNKPAIQWGRLNGADRNVRLSKKFTEKVLEKCCFSTNVHSTMSSLKPAKWRPSEQVLLNVFNKAAIQIECTEMCSPTMIPLPEGFIAI